MGQHPKNYHCAKSVLFSTPFRFWEYPSTLTRKVGVPPALTKIEKLGGIGLVSEKSQLYYVFKAPLRGRPPSHPKF